ncbi:MAG: ATP synthase F1 subunit delta [Marinifilaceae bacterium]
MNESKISVRYAKALFQLGKEQQKLETLKVDMALVLECCQTVSDFWLMVESPVVKTSQKKDLTNQIFKGKVDDLTLKFLGLVVENKREIYLKDISRNFLDLCRKDLGIKSAVLTSAVPVGEEGKQKMIQVLKESFQADIELEERIDKELIGGFILRVDDKQLDASVAYQLNRIKRELLSANQMGKN